MSRLAARRALWAAPLMLALAGCVSNPNTMVFGTSTTFGVSAGAGAASSPAIVVGYQRQEAVVMPLVITQRWGEKGFESCDTSKAPSSSLCKLVGTGLVGGERGADALSVMASFGTKGDVGTGTEAKLNGRITQYFATGLAARELARASGAAAVATGEAARLSVSPLVAQLQDDRAAVAAKIKASTDLAATLGKLDSANGSVFFAPRCKDVAPAVCATTIETSSSFDGFSHAMWGRFLAALN